MSHNPDPREAFLKEINTYQPLERAAASQLYDLLRIRPYNRKENLWVDCDGGSGGGGSSGGGGGSGGGGSGGGGGGGGSGSSGDASAPGDYVEEAVASFYIINKLKKPCFVSAYSSIKNNSQSLNRIQSIFNNFNSSYIYSFTIDENYDPQHPFNTGKHDNGTIYLNQYALEHSSREMVVSTILHEMLHVHILTLEYADHNTISQQYVQPFMEALTSIFPNLSQYDANALAWSGLQETTAWDGIVLNGLATPILLRMHGYLNRADPTNPPPYGTPCL